MKETGSDSKDVYKARRTLDNVKKTLNYESKVISNILETFPDFQKTGLTARGLKWTFVAIAQLQKTYAISGKERDFAEGVVDYYRAIAKERSPEWVEYLNTGRTGRVDTEAVKLCIAELCNRVLNSTTAEPLDPSRHFSRSQRGEILRRAESHCQNDGCGTTLSTSNYHADHIIPHSRGGKTDVENGRALCSACNRVKGNKWREDVGVSLRQG